MFDVKKIIEISIIILKIVPNTLIPKNQEFFIKANFFMESHLQNDTLLQAKNAML